MTLSKKHFKAIAEILRTQFTKGIEQGSCNKVFIEEMMNDFCNYFRTENYKFDRDRFNKAVMEDK